MEDLYKTLGVNESATTSEIKHAYRRKALELHPDKNKSNDARERFIEVHEAYKVLTDSQLRSEYDNLDYSYANYESDQYSTDFQENFKRAEREATTYADDFDLFSKNVLTNNILTFLFGALQALFVHPSKNSIGLILIFIGWLFYSRPMAPGQGPKPEGLSTFGITMIVIGIFLVIRRWIQLTKKHKEFKDK